MKKTLLLSMDFAPSVGGVANYWANLCRSLPADELVVLAPEAENSLDFDIRQNYLIYRKNLLSKNGWVWPKWWPFLWRAFRLVKREKIKQIIAAEILPGGTIAYLIKKHYGIPYVLSFHGLDIASALLVPRKAKLMKKIIENADKIIVNSQFTKDRVLAVAAKYKGQIEVIYPCPNIKSQEISPVLKSEVIADLGLEHKKVILTVARLVERKGHLLALEALPQVLKKIPDLVYLIVGSGVFKNKLAEKIAQLNLQDHVKILSDVDNDELPIFFDLADVFVMPCRSLDNGDVEGFGIVFVEANSFGKPVIAGRSGGAVEAVEHNVNGLIVDSCNVNELTQAILSLLNNEIKAQALGEAGRRRVEKFFDWRLQSEKLLKILEQ